LLRNEEIVKLRTQPNCIEVENSSAFSELRTQQTISSEQDYYKFITSIISSIHGQFNYKFITSMRRRVTGRSRASGRRSTRRTTGGRGASHHATG
jgi:hypothetical protein